MPTLLSGVKPTNVLTLGNLLGAINNWVALQAQYDCIFLVVDLHAITVAHNPTQLREHTYRVAANYIAAGIDPARAILCCQSHVPQHAELAWVLTCASYMGELNRMTQYKDKSATAGANIPVGLFTYPALMAADILLYRTNLVPVGADQKQHLELARDLAIRMNNRYGTDLFVVPEGFIPPVGARIMSLSDPTAKMSKSDDDPQGTISLTDSDDVIRRKVKRAVTDSGTEITYDETKPGVRNLINIQAAITGRPPVEIVNTYAGKQYGPLKLDTAELIVSAVAPIRERTEQWLRDRTELDRVLQQGAARARAIAQSTLDRVYAAIGFVPRQGTAHGSAG
ncbi:MAG: tryptophan--tRNA ligase [Deltaproteobacteria bacterium]|nr:tryptophan--tRNA ligase [Deltaproteobacteria bacterium]